MFTWLLTAAHLHAIVRLPDYLSEHAVLQRSPATTVWGKADPGEKVRVSLGAIHSEIVTGSDGRWEVSLNLSKADSKANDLVIEGKNKLVVRDVVVGEVWLTSGQSNMQMPLSANASDLQEAQRSTNNLLRWFQTETSPQYHEPMEDIRGHWEIASPEVSGACSAVAYYFGKSIQQDLKAPVGLILTAVGGTTIQSWISEETWSSAEAVRTMIKPPRKTRPITTPSFYYNQLIHPLGPLTFRGVLWYQGEAHFSQGPFYRAAFPLLINDWRQHFKKPDLPFYFCQLPNLDKKTADPNDEGWVAEVREAQDSALSLPNTGQAVLIDAGSEDLHAVDKRIVGERLANLAKSDLYERKIAARSPRFKKADRKGDKLVIEFDNTEGGLMAVAQPTSDKPNSPGSRVSGFAIKADNGPWVWAKAEIHGNVVHVWAPEIPRPKEVRYAWANNPTCLLAGKSGLPVTPFRAVVPDSAK